MTPHQQQLLERYEKGIAVFEEAFRGTPSSILDKAPSPGKWSIRQIVVHVADAELVAAMRFRLIAAESGSSLTPFDQDKWANNMNYAAQSADDAMRVYSLVRKLTADMVQNLPESAWTNVSTHLERGATSLEYLEHMAIHSENHAEQIRRIRRQFEPGFSG